MQINEDTIELDDIIINKKDFETWLNDHDKFDWCNDHSENGEHIQDTGKLSIEQYYESCYVADDVREYNASLQQLDLEKSFDKLKKIMNHENKTINTTNN